MSHWGKDRPLAIGDVGMLRRPGHGPIGLAERRYLGPLAAKLARRPAWRTDDVSSIDLPQAAAGDNGGGDALELALAVGPAKSVDHLIQERVGLVAHRSSP